MELSRTIETDTGEMIVKRVSVPLGLEELMEGLAKEVILKKPRDLYIFAAEYFRRLLQLRDSGLYRGNVRSAKLAVKRPFRATVVGQNILSKSESKESDKPNGRKTPHPRKSEENSNKMIENRRAMIQNHLRKKQEIETQNKQPLTDNEKKPPSRSKLPTRSRSLSKSSSGKSQEKPENDNSDSMESRRSSSEKDTIEKKKTRRMKISPRSRSSSISSSSSSTKETREIKRMDSITEKNANVCGTENLNKLKGSPEATSEDVEMVTESDRRCVQRSMSLTQDKNGHYEVLYRPTPLPIGEEANRKSENTSTDKIQSSGGEGSKSEELHISPNSSQNHTSEVSNEMTEVGEESKSEELHVNQNVVLSQPNPSGQVSEETSEVELKSEELHDRPKAAVFQQNSVDETLTNMDDELSKSAVAIQSLWRGRKERQRLKVYMAVTKEKNLKNEEAEKLDQVYSDSENIVPVKLSKDQPEDEKFSVGNTMEEVKSAIALQSLWRGRQERQRLRNAMAVTKGNNIKNEEAKRIDEAISENTVPEKLSEESLLKEPPEDVKLSAENTMAEVKSAIALQSLWRGRQARQALRKDFIQNTNYNEGDDLMKREKENSDKNEIESQNGKSEDVGKHELELSNNQVEEKANENHSDSQKHEVEVTETNVKKLSNDGTEILVEKNDRTEIKEGNNLNQNGEESQTDINEEKVGKKHEGDLQTDLTEGKRTKINDEIDLQNDESKLEKNEDDNKLEFQPNKINEEGKTESEIELEDKEVKGKMNEVESNTDEINEKAGNIQEMKNNEDIGEENIVINEDDAKKEESEEEMIKNIHESDAQKSGSDTEDKNEIELENNTIHEKEVDKDEDSQDIKKEENQENETVEIESNDRTEMKVTIEKTEERMNEQENDSKLPNHETEDNERTKMNEIDLENIGTKEEVNQNKSEIELQNDDIEKSSSIHDSNEEDSHEKTEMNIEEDKPKIILIDSDSAVKTKENIISELQNDKNVGENNEISEKGNDVKIGTELRNDEINKTNNKQTNEKELQDNEIEGSEKYETDQRGDRPKREVNSDNNEIELQNENTEGRGDKDDIGLQKEVIEDDYKKETKEEYKPENDVELITNEIEEERNEHETEIEVNDDDTDERKNKQNDGTDLQNARNEEQINTNKDETESSKDEIEGTNKEVSSENVVEDVQNKEEPQNDKTTRAGSSSDMDIEFQKNEDEKLEIGTESENEAVINESELKGIPKDNERDSRSDISNEEAKSDDESPKDANGEKENVNEIETDLKDDETKEQNTTKNEITSQDDKTEEKDSTDKTEMESQKNESTEKENGGESKNEEKGSRDDDIVKVQNDKLKEKKDVERSYHRSDTIEVSNDVTHEGTILEDIDVPNKEAISDVNASKFKANSERKGSKPLSYTNNKNEECDERQEESEKKVIDKKNTKRDLIDKEGKQNSSQNQKGEISDNSRRSKFKHNKTQSYNLSSDERGKKRSDDLRRFHSQGSENSMTRRKSSRANDTEINNSKTNSGKEGLKAKLPSTLHLTNENPRGSIHKAESKEGEDPLLERQDEKHDENVEEIISEGNETEKTEYIPAKWEKDEEINTKSIGEPEGIDLGDDIKKYVELEDNIEQENTATDDKNNGEIGNNQPEDNLSIEESFKSNDIDEVVTEKPIKLGMHLKGTSNLNISNDEQKGDEEMDERNSVQESLITKSTISKLGQPPPTNSDKINGTSSSVRVQEENNAEGNIETEQSHKVIPENPEKESAIKIQTIWRGFQARKRLKSLLEEHQVGVDNHPTLMKKLSGDFVKDENENLPETRNKNLSDATNENVDKQNDHMNGKEADNDDTKNEAENKTGKEDNGEKFCGNKNESGMKIQSASGKSREKCEESGINSSSEPETKETAAKIENMEEIGKENDKDEVESSEAQEEAPNNSESCEASERKNYTDEEMNAAKTIQSTFRQSRKQPPALEEKSSHSISDEISCSYGKTKEEIMEGDNPGSTEITDEGRTTGFSVDEMKAATKIQNTFRKTRKQRSKPRLEDFDLNSDSGKEYLKEVLKIQSAWRAYKVRKNIRDVENKISNIETKSGNHVKSSIHLTDQEILKAVTKIQAGLRGYLTRKHLNNIRERNEALDRIKEESYSDYSRMSSTSSTDDQLLEILKQVEGAKIPDTLPDGQFENEDKHLDEIVEDSKQAVEEKISTLHFIPLKSHPSIGSENADTNILENVTHQSSSDSTSEDKSKQDQEIMIDEISSSRKDHKIDETDANETSENVENTSENKHDSPASAKKIEKIPITGPESSAQEVSKLQGGKSVDVEDDAGGADVGVDLTARNNHIVHSGKIVCQENNKDSNKVSTDSEESEEKQNSSADPEDNITFPVKGSLKKTKAIDNLVELAEKFEDNNDPLEETKELKSSRDSEGDAEKDIESEFLHGRESGEKLASFEIPDEFELDASETETSDVDGMDKSSVSKGGSQKSSGDRRTRSANSSEVNHEKSEEPRTYDDDTSGNDKESSNIIKKHENLKGIEIRDNNPMDMRKEESHENKNSSEDTVKEAHDTLGPEKGVEDRPEQNFRGNQSSSPNKNYDKIIERGDSVNGNNYKDKRPTLTDFMKKTLDLQSNHSSETKTPNKLLDIANDTSDKSENSTSRMPIQSRYEAATKIQSLYRGYTAREQVKKLKASQDESTKKKEGADISVNDRKSTDDNSPKTDSTDSTIHASVDEIHHASSGDSIMQETQTRDIGVGANGNVNMEGSQENVPAGVEILTTETQNPNADVGRASGDVETDAQSSLEDAGTQDVLSNKPGVESEREMESTKRNNSTLRNKNMEAEAATKIQAGFRGYKVRKQLKMKDTPTESVTRKTVRRKSSSCLTENQAKKQKENIDLQEKSAVKIQAGIRGFLVRKRVKKPQKSQE